VAASLAACLGLVACVDTEGAMRDYIDRSQSLRDTFKVPDTDVPNFEGTPPANASSGTYVASCLSPLVGKNTAQLLRFKTAITYEPSGPLGRNIRISFMTMPTGNSRASSALEPLFPSDQASGTASVSEKGTFVLKIGNTPKLPAEGNAITNVLWGIDNLKLGGALTKFPESFCANLFGRSRPSGLDAAGTVCVFRRVTDENSPVDDLDAASYASCP
jgi:hypothetical protein